MIQIRNKETKPHALIITAYYDVDMLYSNLEKYAEICDCYIHFDRKMRDSDQIVERFNLLDNVFAINEYYVNWGSYEHIEAVLSLLKIASASANTYGYYHIMSENTVIAVSREAFQKAFDVEVESNYIEVREIDKMASNVKDYLQGRYRYYYFNGLFNQRTKLGRLFNKWSLKLQMKIGVRRNVKLQYKGYLYCSLTHAFVLFALNYIVENPKYMMELKRCDIPEEFFFKILL